MLSSKQIHGKLAVAHRVANRTPPEQIKALRRDYLAARLAEHIEQVVTIAPQFTPEQMQRLSEALHGSDGRRAAV